MSLDKSVYVKVSPVPGMLFCAPVWNRGRQKQRHLSETFRQDRSAGSKGFAGKSPHIYAECCGCMLSCSYCYQKDRLWLSDCFAVVRNRYGGALNFDIIRLITGLFDILRSNDYIRGYLRKCNWIYIPLPSRAEQQGRYLLPVHSNRFPRHGSVRSNRQACHPRPHRRRLAAKRTPSPKKRGKEQQSVSAEALKTGRGSAKGSSQK